MSFRGASPPRAPPRALPWTRWGPWRYPDPLPIQGAPTNVNSWIRACLHIYEKSHDSHKSHNLTLSNILIEIMRLTKSCQLHVEIDNVQRTKQYDIISYQNPLK